MRRIGAAVAALAVLAAACSGGGGDDEAAPDTAGAAGEAATTTTAAAETTTTTEPEPELLPVGAVWEPFLPVDVVASLDLDAVAAGGDVWFVGHRDNAPLALRSVDGAPPAPVDLGSPPPNGNARLKGVVDVGDGRVVLWGERGTECSTGLPVEGGYLRGAICSASRGITFVSADGGTTFTYHEPPELDRGGIDSVELEGMVHDGERFVALGTVRAPDWHARLWTSPDGVTWTVASELRDPDGSTTATGLAFDGSTFVAAYDAHPCAFVPNDPPGAPGWVFGPQWPRHVRLAAGADPAALAPVTSAELPIAPDPRPVDCAVDDPFSLAQEPYPRLELTTVGGVATVVDVSAEEAGRTPGEYQVAQLVDGSWTGAELVTDPDVTLEEVVDADGRPAVVERGVRVLERGARVAVLDDDGVELVEAVLPYVGSSVTGAAWGDGVLWVVTRDQGPENATWRLVIWRSAATPADALPACQLGPGALCPGADLTLVDGYPDLAGVDLSGADLRQADLGDASFDGASFRGAMLTGADSGSGASFVGADLSGADLRRADLAGLDGVVLTGAQIESAFLDFAGLPASLADVTLANARLRFDPSLGPLDLGGLDLTDAAVGASFASEELLVIGDLRGAVVEGLRLDDVDLRQANLEGVDLSLVAVGEDSICPDGSAPTGEQSFDLRCG